MEHRRNHVRRQRVTKLVPQRVSFERPFAGAEGDQPLAAVGPLCDHDRALADAAHWRTDDGRPLSVAVNVSAIQLRRDDFVPIVEAALARFPGARLELEITESLIMQDVEAVIAENKALYEGLKLKSAA